MAVVTCMQCGVPIEAKEEFCNSCKQELSKPIITTPTPSCKCGWGLQDTGTALRCPRCRKLADYIVTSAQSQEGRDEPATQ